MVFFSHSHNLCTEEVKKKSFSREDDKRYLLTKEQSKKLNKMQTDTLAWGHYAIPKN